MDDASETAGPAVVAANWFRFRRGQRIRYERVMSVCFLWALEGSGTVTSCGRDVAVTPATVLRLPWDHDVAYRAAARHPFRLGTVHLVPRYARDEAVLPQVPHVPGDPLFDAPGRADVPGGPRSPQLLDASDAAGRRLIALGELTVEHVLRGELHEEVLRALGVLWEAQERGRRAPDASPQAVPVAVEVMLAFIEVHLGEPLSVTDIARAGDCSPSTAQRLFAQHTGRSVTAHLRSLRMREAASLLRTSGLQVHEVAREVGYPDPLHFSRAFRQAFGTPPSRYARSGIRL